MPRLVIPVEPVFHERVRQYARANNRSIAKLVRHVLLQYMRQNPVFENGHDVTERPD